ncbi:MAG: pyridoxine 4-dehydrogenase [Thermoleophilaceae bacterium]|jgi:aryl-alcohol dehydrogenase-like predicted oxidoreductase|nr:pyridoxine 4-dehydrogenase [Thermoleophilaceae bacterium]
MTDTTQGPVAAASGTFEIGGELPVHRLGFGAMQLTGRGVWGEPDDPDECRRVLQRAVELGVNLIDTANSYGPEVSERLIAEALHPYPDDLVIATKAGFERPGPGQWVMNGDPSYLKRECEGSLRRLRLDCIPLFQLHRIDDKVPVADQIGALTELRDEGKIRFIGLSEVSVSQLEEVRALTPVATVQNKYNLGDRSAEPVLDECERQGLGFIPWFPLNTGHLAGAGGPLAAAAERHGATPAQLALAWLLHRSPVMLPIPGTSKVDHLEDNMKAATIDLSEDEVAALEEAGER